MHIILHIKKENINYGGGVCPQSVGDWAEKVPEHPHSTDNVPLSKVPNPEQLT